MTLDGLLPKALHFNGKFKGTEAHLCWLIPWECQFVQLLYEVVQLLYEGSKALGSSRMERQFLD